MRLLRSLRFLAMVHQRTIASPPEADEAIFMDSLLDDLNQEQRAAVTHGDGPMLIVAGAGTGKTAVITKRIAWLIREKRATAQGVLALTFTEKAAGEMEERLDRLLPYGYTDLWVSTFHSFCERILRRHALEIGLPHDFKVLSQTTAWLLLQKHIEDLPLKLYRPLGNPTKFLHALLQHISRCKDELITPDEYLRHAQEANLDLDTDLIAGERARLTEIANAYAAIQKLFRDQGALDFGDLIGETIRLLRERPLVLKKYRDQFQEILVDEFQDTNIAQFELVGLLAGERKQVVVVADDDQAIYKFRGASVSNILSFKKEFPHAREVVLTQNYRSMQSVLDAAYCLIQHNNPDRLEVTLQGLSKKLSAARGGGGIVQCLHFATLQDEIRGVISKIIEQKSGDSETTWDDFAILARSNQSAEPFTRALADAGMPVQNVASRGLYQKSVVLEILSYLTALVDPEDSVNMYRALSNRRSGLAEDDLTALSHWSSRKNWALVETMRKALEVPTISGQGREAIRSFLASLDRYAALARTTRPTPLLLQIVEELGLLKDLSGDESLESQESLLHLNAFAKRVWRFEDESLDPTLKDFVAQIRLEREAGDEGALPFDVNVGPETVKVMTAHAAKGLEFKYVFAVNMVEQRFPSRDQGEPIPVPDALVREILPQGDIHLQEERRLFYVACTRARDGLFCTFADDYGGVRKRKPSRFLGEAGLVASSAVVARSFMSRMQNDERGTRLQRLAKHGGQVNPRATEASPPIPTTFSFTQLKAFETCPLQYKYAHILKIPVRGKATFSFGKSIHHTLQRFFQLVKDRTGTRQGSLFGNTMSSGPVATLDELLGIFEESWIDDWYGSKEEKMRYYEQGKRSLKALYESLGEHIPVPRAIEEGFTISIGSYKIRGRIDRVDDRPDGTVEIIDYKTGKAHKLEDVDRDQLLIYQIASEEVRGEKPSALTYYYIDGGSRVSFLGTSEELKGLKEKVIQTIDAIRSSEFLARPSVQNCKYCDFKNICPFAKLT